MAVTVKAITLWRREVENRPGMLAETLEPLARAGVDLQSVMGYRVPGREGQAVIELHPVSGRKAMDAARAGGLGASDIPALQIDGDNRPGLGHTLAKALAGAGINIAFVVALTSGRRYTGVFGFDTAADAKKASAVIRKASAPPRRAPARKRARG
jgi:hypothetical protein